jgi:hypothetical protein
VILGVVFVVLLLLVFYWTSVAAPRRANRLLGGLERLGYSPVDPQDARLAAALARLTPIPCHTYELSTVTKTSAWRVRKAYARSDSRSNRYCALVDRAVFRTPPRGTVVEHQFTIALLEQRALPFDQDVHFAGDRYSLDPGYHLLRVPEISLGALSSLYVAHTPDGALAPLPGSLESALIESAPFLSVEAATGIRGQPFLFSARLRFASEGWGLISNEFIYLQRKMAVFIEVVDRISRSLP